jgi:hypothetical protein
VCIYILRVLPLLRLFGSKSLEYQNSLTTLVPETLMPQKSYDSTKCLKASTGYYYGSGSNSWLVSRRLRNGSDGHFVGRGRPRGCGREPVAGVISFDRAGEIRGVSGLNLVKAIVVMHRDRVVDSGLRSSKETRGVVAVARWFHFLLNGGEAISAAGETGCRRSQKPTWG